MDLTKLSQQILQHEGLRLMPYKDTVGKLTIGVGHNLTDKGLTRTQAMFILHDDINDVINFLHFRLPWVELLDDVRQRAITDLTFDLMGGILSFKQMLIHLQRGEWNEAADELLSSLFAKQTGQRAIDLAHMIHTGTDPTT